MTYYLKIPCRPLMVLNSEKMHFLYSMGIIIPDVGNMYKLTGRNTSADIRRVLKDFPIQLKAKTQTTVLPCLTGNALIRVTSKNKLISVAISVFKQHNRVLYTEDLIDIMEDYIILIDSNIYSEQSHIICVLDWLNTHPAK